MYKLFIRPFLFLFAPEKVHHLVFAFLKLSLKLPCMPALLRFFYTLRNKQLERKVFGLNFPNPVGLAAGMDKNAEAFAALANLGFGFVEIGTVTPEGQAGNPKPRLFRLPKNKAIINRMGFNNEGLNAAIEKLKRRNTKLIIGGNIGKNTATPNENAVSDYEKCFEGLFPYVDYFVVNVSCPNVSDLRKLQDQDSLLAILNSIQKLNAEKQKRKPVLLKISPDLNNEQIDQVIEIIELTKIDGVVASNTTISREKLSYSQEEIKAIGNGGLSGEPLRERSTEIIRYISEKSNGKIDIIGVGGIFSAEDAIEKLNAGAKLVQLYSGFIYEGPGIVKKINKALINK